MAKKQTKTASFLIRFTQQIFEGDDGTTDVQWRGNISHVQGGEDKNFVGLDPALEFMQSKLGEMTMHNTADKSQEEQEGLFKKSMSMFRDITQQGPKFVMDTIKDPKATVSQIKEQISEVGEEIGQKLEIDSWRAASKNDFRSLIEKIDNLGKQIQDVSQKLEAVENKIKG